VYVRTVGVKDSENVIYISEVIYELMCFFVRNGICVYSTCCRKISDRMLGEGAPIASPSFYLCTWLL
jgi:hypothetical protein